MCNGVLARLTTEDYVTMAENAEPGDAEAARLRAVERYRIAGTSPDAMFGRVAVLAAQFFDTAMATISIVDHGRIWFVGAVGLGEHVRQLARDDGLCASVIRSDVPYVVCDALTDPRTTDNRFVHEQGIRFHAGVPIVTSDGHRLGALAVMDRHARTASAKELAILEGLAAVVMEQLELRLAALDALRVEQWLRGVAEDDRDTARRNRDSAELDRDGARRDRDQAHADRDNAMRDRGIAERDRDLIEGYATVLQRTLLPPRLPDIEGMVLGSYFRPASASQVSGDFYDVFGLGGARWAFFIGDVLGHGPEAAVVSSMIRYTLRSAALHYSDLTEGLGELNSVLLREAEPRRFCTVLFGTMEPHPDGDGYLITVASGGHPPALLVDPTSGLVDEVHPRGGMLVGALANATFAARRVHLRVGQTLLCYTDGLIEARRGATPFDQDGLAAFAFEHAPGGAQGLIDDIATLVPKLDPSDDIAVLAFEAVSAHANQETGRTRPPGLR
jgi:sigma-B regulation protein RsbU (phosphoserine phosphatase)